ncbi:hypothetical protein KQI65_06905 [bacterium]|nr:hypothetical protein [bacterium]
MLRFLDTAAIRLPSRYCRHLFVALLLSCLFASTMFAQDTTSGVKDSTSSGTKLTVVTHDGETLQGVFHHWSADSLFLISEEGRMTGIPRRDLENVSESAMLGGEYGEGVEVDSTTAAFRERPASGILLVPTAWQKPSGHPLLALYELYFISGSVSFDDLITLSANVTVPGLTDRGEGLLGFGMKISPIVRESFALAAGLYAVRGYDDYEGVTAYYVCMSFFIDKASCTIGLASATAQEKYEEWHALPFLGVDLPVSSDAHFLFEASAFEAGAGVRIQSGRAVFELGGIYIYDDADFSVLPWLGIGFLL